MNLFDNRKDKVVIEQDKSPIKQIIIQIIEDNKSVTESIVVGIGGKDPFACLTERLDSKNPWFVDKSNNLVTYFNHDKINKVIVLRVENHEKKI